MRAGDGGGDGEQVRARNGEGADEGAGGSDGWKTRAKREWQHRMANARTTKEGELNGGKRSGKHLQQTLRKSTNCPKAPKLQKLVA